MPENDSDFLLAADGFATNLTMYMFSMEMIPLMSGNSLKNALSLCVNEGNEAAAVFSRQPNGEDVTGAYVFSSKKLMTLIKNGASRSAEELSAPVIKNTVPNRLQMRNERRL